MVSLYGNEKFGRIVEDLAELERYDVV